MIDPASELSALAKALSEVDSKGPIVAICVVCSGDGIADEKAYWRAIRLGAQRCDFLVIGDAGKLKEVDADWDNVTSFLPVGTTPPNGNVIIIDATELLN
jgi:hypothetical protein